ncbi:MAG TPA: dihydrolipoyl dehydrogenase, partial [Polyangiaceae bacterium]|nr:dihydrolipoyl dehydrogenase [Polyangiaceae bacterium]
MSTRHDLVVIGGGPGGYFAAIRGAQLGLNTACIDVEHELGGTCVRIGCIPSKVLLEASERYHEAKTGLSAFGVNVSGVELDLAKMLSRKESIVRQLTGGVAFLLKKNKITRYEGRGRFAGPGKVVVEAPDGTSTELEAKHIVIATGSNVAPLKGVEMDGHCVGTSTDALSYTEVPGHLVVIGAGYIGLELGSVWNRLGAKVTVLEYLDRILPGMDSELAAEGKKIFEKQGLTFRLGTRVTGARTNGNGATVTIDGADAIDCDKVLSCTGRVANTDGLGLDAIGLQKDERGRVPVDEHFRTKVPGVYAIGDVIAGPMLAHKAEDEGIACVEHIVTGYGHVNYDAIPGIVYTQPEIATVGKSEDELKKAGRAYKKGMFPFQANGRAKALGAAEGRVKVLADAATDRVLGVHII